MLLKDYIKVIILENINNKKHLFIRFGTFSKGGGRSRVGLDNEFKQDVLSGKQFEAGLSVYFVKPHKNGFWIQEPNRRRAAYGIGADYFGHMFQNIFMDALRKGEIFLVSGDLIEVPENYEDEDSGEYISTGRTTYEVGSDGEPVIENVKIIKRLEPSEVYIDGWGEKTIEDIYSNQYNDNIIIEDYLELTVDNEELRDVIETMSPDSFYAAESELKRNNVLQLLDILSNLWDRNNKIDPEDFIKIAIKLNKKILNPKKTIQKLKDHFKIS